MVNSNNRLTDLINRFDKSYIWNKNKFKSFYYGKLYQARCSQIGKGFTLGEPIGRPHIPGAGQVEIGDDVTIYGPIELISYTNAQIKIGARTSFGVNCTINSRQSVKIGSDCLIALSVLIYDHNGHPLDPDKRIKHMSVSNNEIKPVTIGNNVWIGGFAHIQPGVIVGDNSIVAAHSVVTKNVPANTIVIGSPARVCYWLDRKSPETGEMLTGSPV